VSGSPLEGRTAIVTGASRGIGLACARALVASGARVALLARGATDLRAVAHELGPHAMAYPCDVTDGFAVRAVADAIRQAFAGAPDIVISNAGSFPLAPLETMPAETFADAIETNLIAPFLLLREFLAEMRARGSGHIVTIGSIADRMVFPENGAYAASKYGLRAMHEVLRAETRGSGVRATLVSPGPVDTPLWDPIQPDSRPGFTPRAAMLSADAVADAVLYAVTRPADTDIEELRLGRS
jgi:NAD(P)-dependent dehydrogenase (short-subunit alcohol dehydrogenase family)